MKFGIDMGHNAPPDVGASSQFGNEDQLTKAVGTLVMDKLKALGHEVVNCTPSSASSVLNSLAQRVQTANNNQVDVYVSIHFNAFNGSANGSEIYAVSDAGRRVAQPILDNIVGLGFSNRRVKNGSHLYVVRNTNMPAILIECCFLDSEKDMRLYNSETMANAIVKGLAGKLPTESTPVPKENQTLKLQESLNKLQIRDANGKVLAEDGIIGPATESATQKFHQLMGINASGRPVSLTWKAIEEIFSQPLMRPNHAEGLAVRYVEHRIGIDIDGVYDAEAAEALENFQRRQGLVVDGIVGPNTWEKLLGTPVPDLAVQVIRDTVFKQEPIDSTQITDPNLKYPIKEGNEFALHSWAEEGNHVKISLL
ncbi:MAG: hypothetical protein F6K03_01670, partial [Kamptonema sp. SIO4C4]|nr:hypothetical protein [Kamptonema sp. SIO4C4]